MAMVPQAPIRDSQRQTARTLRQCPGPPRARSPPARTCCDLTKHHFMTPYPPAREVSLSLPSVHGRDDQNSKGELSMRRVKVVLIALPMMLAAFVLASSAAFASSPHFKKGGEPVCTFSGTTSIPVSCTGTLAGLGNEDLNLHLSVNGFALYQCQNGGSNVAPGQNKVLQGPATSDTAVPASAIKNGNLE